jgi:hypothetical protein
MCWLVVFRMLSQVFACLSVGQGSGANSTDGGQDKSRNVRGSRTGAERKGINHLAQCAFGDRTLSMYATSCEITTNCTLRAFSS